MDGWKLRLGGMALTAGLLGCASGVPRQQSLVVTDAQLKDLGSGPMTVTRASSDGQSQAICYATARASCSEATVGDERTYVLFTVDKGGTWKSQAVVPRGYRLCCGYQGPSGGDMDVAMTPHVPIGVEPGPSSGAPAQRWP